MTGQKCCRKHGSALLESRVLLIVNSVYGLFRAQAERYRDLSAYIAEDESSLSRTAERLVLSTIKD